MSDAAPRHGLLLVGGGKMGGAMLAGWLDQGLPAADVMVVEPFEDSARELRSRLGVAVVGDAASLPADARPEVVVFAVKPQMMDDVTPGYRRFAGPGTVFLSIAAGRTIASFERILGEAAIVRAMPNTPAAIRRGITVACPNARVSADQRQRCTALLEAVGDVGWVDDESLMDAVTAVSGSGPAYVFLLTECLAGAGGKAGLPEDLARQLAAATVAGAGELMRRSAEDPATLRRNVTSPGGTTAAALDVLMAEDGTGLADLMARAVDAAVQRGRDLAG